MNANILAGLLFIIILFIWLFFDLLKLKRGYQDLLAKVDRNEKDLAGLCSAAVNVDHRLINSDQLVKSLLSKIADQEGNEDSSKPYQSVIRKIQEGASEEELMLTGNLSQEEARLLIRLHGSAD